MKKLLFLATILACTISAKSQKFKHIGIVDTVPQYAYDTVKVRIQIDDGPGIAILINGYLVRKFISYGHLHPWGKLYSKEKFMSENYITIDPIRIWDYREREWRPGEPGESRFVAPRSVF